MASSASLGEQLPHLKDHKGHCPQHNPYAVLSQGDRRSAQELLQGWDVMDGQLQDKAEGNHQAQWQVRKQTHLPDGPHRTTGSKGTQELRHHQHRKGRFTGLGEVASAIPLIGKRSPE